MKRIFISLLFLLPVLSYGQTATVTGTAYDFGLVGTRADIIVYEVVRSGYLITMPTQGMRVQVSTTGAFKFTVPQSVGTDTTKIRVFVNATNWKGQGDKGVWINLPTGSTHTLVSLTPTSYIPSSYPVIVSRQLFYDSTGAAVFLSDTLHIGTGLLAVPKGNGSNDYTLISTASGGTDTTSLSYRIDAVKTTADNALPKSDTTALHAQQLADIRAKNNVQDDTLTAHKTAIDTKQNVLTAAQIARLDSSLAAGYAISITSAGTIQIIAVDTTGFFAAFGGVITESDPTATAKAQVVAKDTTDKNVPRVLAQGGGGALGQVLAVGPGGARIWKDDSAGSGTPGATFKTDSTTLYKPVVIPGPNYQITMNNNGSLYFGSDVSGNIERYGKMQVSSSAMNISLKNNNVQTIAFSANPGNGTFAGALSCAYLGSSGRVTSGDTIRAGDYTTYSYFIPGGALVQSSTQEIKRNITVIDPPSGIFAKFLSVKPRRYQWRPEAFRTVTFESTPDTLTDAERWAIVTADSLKAEKQAERWQIGLIAEEFNQNIFGRVSREIDQAEVTTALWIVLRETVREAALLRDRVETLETQMAQGQAAIQNLLSRAKALEAK
jgi:hypothetical protein